MTDIKNEIGIKLIDIEGSDEKSVQVMAPELSVKQSGFSNSESVFLLKMAFNVLVKRPPDDPKGWMFINRKEKDEKEVPKNAVVSIKDSGEDGVLICTNVSLRECRIIRKKKQDGTFEDAIEVELSVS